MAQQEVAYKGFEYRVVGREVHRRPIDREGLAPWQAAWEVMNQDHHYVPATVREQFSQPPALRFD